MDRESKKSVRKLPVRSCKVSKTQRVIVVPHRVKPYDTPEDPEKLRINRLYARRSVSYVGRRSQHVILDSVHCVTSNTLINKGVPSEKIWAPNINRYDCKGLEQIGVNSPKKLFDDFLGAQSLGRCDVVPSSCWYDSMTSVTGGGVLQTYPVVVLDRFLLANRRVIRQACFFAITLSMRNSEGPRTLYGKCYDTFKEQVKRLALIRGFTIGKKYSEVYKKGQWYGHWELRYDPAITAGKKKKPMLMWRDAEDHIVGCPPGYVI